MMTGRRSVLAGLGASLGVATCCGPAALAAHTGTGASARAARGSVDVHHHFYPQFLMDAWAAAPTEGDWTAYKDQHGG